MSVRIQIQGAIATIRIESPATRNALGPEEWRQLDEAVTQADRDGAVRALIVTGEGGVFSSGGDVKTMPERLALAPAERRTGLLLCAAAIRRLHLSEKPSIAAIDGACVGAGLSLALACDLRVASPRAKLGATFHRVGLTWDFGALYFLPRVVGPARALELVLLGDVLDADAAHRLGLVNRVVTSGNFEAEVRSLAERVAAGPPIATSLSKAGLRHHIGQSLDGALEWEAAAQAIASRSDDAREGLAALAEKRSPKFAGR